jgi:hypothetical protein
MGRFFGTLMSGLLYQWGGLAWALSGSAVLLAICWVVTLALPAQSLAGAGAAADDLDHGQPGRTP